MYPDIQSKAFSQLLLWFAAYCLNVSDQQLHLEDIVDAHKFAILGSVGPCIAKSLMRYLAISRSGYAAVAVRDCSGVL
jgi:hypothetical protein